MEENALTYSVSKDGVLRLKGNGLMLPGQFFQDSGFLKNIKAIKADAGNPYYRAEGGILYSKDGKTLVRCPGGKPVDVRIPEGIECIWPKAFSDTRIKSISFPDSMRRIGENTFTGAAIGNIEFGKGIRIIGAYAFMDAKILSVRIPGNVVLVQKGAFEYCKYLRNIEFAEGLNEIEDDAFEGCPAERISLPGSLLRIGTRNFSSVEEATILGGRPIPGLIRALATGKIVGRKRGFVLLRFQGKEYAVPIRVDDEFNKKLSCTWDMGIFDERMLVNSFRYATGALARQDASLFAAAEYGIQDARQATVEQASEMAERYILNKDMAMLKMLLTELGRLDANALLSGILDAADKMGDATAKAYVLQALSKKGAANPGTAL